MKKSTSENSFWIVYADLMAGLLFIFILLVSAIITKYIISQQNLAAKSSQLNQSEQLIISKDELLSRMQTELSKLNLSLKAEQDDNEQLGDLLASLGEKNDRMSQELDAKDLQISALAAALNAKDLSINERNRKIAALQDDLGKIRADFAQLKDYKSALIRRLSAMLDDDLLIDLHSGSIQLASNVLFDKASYELKPQSSAELAKILRKYFTAVEKSGLINSIDAIIIEGHTDSDGGYLYNLELSQKRSLEILKFIYELNPPKEILSRLSAVGRGYLQPRLADDGSEDKAASRRIEIKLIFSNNNALNEYEKSINDLNFNRL